MDKKDFKIIKEIIEDFFSKMTFSVLSININLIDSDKKNNESISVEVKLQEPQILIGEKGQTLFEIQKLLRMILNKKLKNIFYLNLDINEYKKKKDEYLKKISKELADEVSFSKKEKEMFPMSSYERRIIHTELSSRIDVKTESRGEGFDRFIVIMPK